MSKAKCPGFSADACTNGYCPNALYEENPDLSERVTCEECYHNTQDCADCIFENTDICVKNQKTS